MGDHLLTEADLGLTWGDHLLTEADQGLTQLNNLATTLADLKANHFELTTLSILQITSSFKPFSSKSTSFARLVLLVKLIRLD